MGNEPPDPDRGDDNLCFAAGRAPLFIYASFSGIEDCFPDWPMGHGYIPGQMILEQNLINSRVYQGSQGGYAAAVTFGVAGRTDIILAFGGIKYFVHSKIGNCETNFTGQFGCGFGLQHGQGGTAALMWAGGGSSPDYDKLVEYFQTITDPRKKWEFWPAPADKTVCRFCTPRDKSRIYIKFDPDVL